MIQTNLPESWQKRWRETFTTATEIQEAVYLPLQEGKNVVGISPTGSGKPSLTCCHCCKKWLKEQGHSY